MTAWWGIVSPRTSESRPLEIVQAAILRPCQASGTTGEASGLPDAEILLTIRSDLFGWEIPGGTLERGESHEVALVREVFEETGLAVEIEGCVGNWERRGFRPHVARVFCCRVVRGVETPSHETPRVAWFAATRPPRALLPWYEGPLQAVLEYRPGDAPRDEVEWQGIGAILRTMRIDLGMRWKGLPRS